MSARGNSHVRKWEAGPFWVANGKGSEVKVRIRYELMTPERAGELARASQSQREVNRANLALITKSLREDEFRFTGDAIIVDQDGMVLDGQHRLLGIEKAGVTQWVLMILGVPTDVQTFIDTRRRVRNLRDTAVMLGYGDDFNKMRIAVARRMISGSADPTGRGSKIENSQFEEYIVPLEAHIRFAYAAFHVGQPPRPGLVGASVLAAWARAHMSGRPASSLQRMAQEVVTGVIDDDRDMPILLLRDELLRGACGGGARLLVAKYRLSEQAIAAALGGRYKKKGGPKFAFQYEKREKGDRGQRVPKTQELFPVESLDVTLECGHQVSVLPSEFEV